MYTGCVDGALACLLSAPVVTRCWCVDGALACLLSAPAVTRCWCVDGALACLLFAPAVTRCWNECVSVSGALREHHHCSSVSGNHGDTLSYMLSWKHLALKPHSLLVNKATTKCRYMGDLPPCRQTEPVNTHPVSSMYRYVC